MNSTPKLTRRMMALGTVASLAGAPSLVRAASLRGFYEVRDFGARGDGKTIDSGAINKAIEAAARGGGGTVVVSPGDYKCFSIRLKDNITLMLSAGATIIAANPDVDGAHYDLPEGVFEEQLASHAQSHYRNSLIYGIGLSNIAIIGTGRIHGLGLDRENPEPRWHGIPGWVSPKDQGLDPQTARLKDPEERRYEGRAGKSIGLKECHNVVLRDFSILQGGHFSVYALGCSNMTIDGLMIDTDRDGIDIDCCRDVRVSNCIVNAPKDDAIVLKSSGALNRSVICEEVSVVNCKTSGYLLGTLLDGTYVKSPYLSPDKVGVIGRIKLGTDSVGGFRNILISDCICENSRGLQLGAIDGGILEDVTFSNISLRDPVNHPFFLRLSVRNRAPVGAGVSQVRRVRFSDITVSGALGAFPCGIVGVEDGIIEDVSLDNVHVVNSGGGTAEDAARIPPERRNSSLEPSFMGVFPAHGLYVRHARNLTIRNSSFEVTAPDARPALYFDDVSGATVSGLSAPNPGQAVKSVNSRDIIVS
ncbi:MAG: glycosyl hydrolase family 28-related protein [Asticcacaulis sp.]|uniref:rhamnogalacturonidase n=1 Tax=Asticcacaulis sp. TaxID=1872648 RepID=UPI0039E248F0